MPCRLLAVRGGVDDLLIILRRQLDGVGVIEASHHDIPIVPYGVLRVHIVVVERVRGDPHLSVAVVSLLCRVPVRWVTVAVPLDSRPSWKVESFIF